MKIINKKFISILLIFLGFTIMFYPTIRGKYITYEQNKLISLWEESLQVIDTDVAEENNDTNDDILEDQSYYFTDNGNYEKLLSKKNSASK